MFAANGKQKFVLLGRQTIKWYLSIAVSANVPIYGLPLLPTALYHLRWHPT